MSKGVTISGLILAGGAGKRVQEQDKGLLLWLGEPLVGHVASRLRPQVDQLLISCNRNEQEYGRFADSPIRDRRSGFQGPLAGIEASAAHVSGEYLIVVACDMPLLPTNLVARLLEPLLGGGRSAPRISFANDGERDQYLCVALHVSCLNSLSEYLGSGQRAVRHWYRGHRTIAVDFSDQHEAFANYNVLPTSSEE